MGDNSKMLSLKFSAVYRQLQDRLSTLSVIICCFYNSGKGPWESSKIHKLLESPELLSSHQGGMFQYTGCDHTTSVLLLKTLPVFMLCGISVTHVPFYLQRADMKSGFKSSSSSCGGQRDSRTHWCITWTQGEKGTHLQEIWHGAGVGHKWYENGNKCKVGMRLCFYGDRWLGCSVSIYQTF